MTFNIAVKCEQTGKGWNACIVPKAMGALNLDTASRQLQHLEHFVMFSSVVVSTGNEGAPPYSGIPILYTLAI